VGSDEDLCLESLSVTKCPVRSEREKQDIKTESYEEVIAIGYERGDGTLVMVWRESREMARKTEEKVIEPLF
jgi:hypothetical protein